MTEFKLSNTAILIDFDGTITKKDSNDLLVEKYLHYVIEDLSQVEEDVNFMESFGSLMSKIRISEEEYLKFMRTEVQLAKGFYDFYLITKSYNIPLSVVSGGFENGIKPFLDMHGLRDIDILANMLKFDNDKLSIEFHHNIANCCDIGSCGNCKVLHYERYKDQDMKVIFIGDGVTDRAVASKADLVFAKDGLLKYCNTNNIDCIAWEDFDDISKYIFDDKLIK